MSEHTDHCTILGRSFEDTDILTRELFDVNMILFDTSPGYRAVVIKAADYIQLMATTEREGYKKPHGFSGANAGIPFNIIALADRTVMLNPKIIAAEGEKISTSNCGSLMLEKPIKVKRFARIRVNYYDLDGKMHEIEDYLPTVQHEVDHNRGILITDREVRECLDFGVEPAIEK